MSDFVFWWDAPDHVCWVDDTLCTDCGGYASYAEYRDSLR